MRFLFILLLYFALSSNILIAEDIDTKKLYLPKFYAQNPYNYLISYHSAGENTSSCNAKIKPFFGIKTKKEFVESPTKAASDGLTAVINGDISLAKSCGDYLLQNSRIKKNALLFPFKFDFIPYMPYKLKSGWISAIAQGLSLGLFTHLYIKTGESRYLKIAEKIFNSYKIPIERGGFTRFYPDSVFFEEYPAEEFIGVFNGAAVAALALWDYYVVTQNKDALLLFNQFIKWLEQNAHRYEKIDEKYNIPITYYSLAIKRAELLFRFYGEGIFLINEISYWAYENDQKRLLYKLKLGSEKDDNPENNIYLFANEQYSNWSAPRADGRFINIKKGIYNHSPFYIAHNSKYEKFEIRIRLKQMSDKPVMLQIYDGKEYINIGEIKGEINKITNASFILNRELIERGEGNIQTTPIVEPKYLDDNYILISLLSEISRSEILKNYSQRWRYSADLVDAEWFNRFPAEIIDSPIKIFESKKICKYGTEDISLLSYDNYYYLFYNCKIEPDENRISLAGGRDIFDLKDMGWVLNNNFLNSNKIKMVTNPVVMADSSFNLLFFKANEMLYSLITDNIWKWNTIKDISPFKYQKFSILNNKGQTKIYAIESEHKNKIILADLFTFEKKEIIKEPVYKAFSDINVFLYDSFKLLLTRAELPNRVDSYLYIACKEDSFIDSIKKPIMIEKSFIKTDYTVRRDYFVFTNGDKTYLLFNGYKTDSDVSTGIYIAQIKNDILKDIIKDTCTNINN